MTAPAAAFAVRLRGLKGWVESFSRKPSARWSLFCVAFVEASCLPLPPDALLLPMGIAQPKQSFRYAAICTAGSIAGAFLGYYIGYALFETVGRPVLEFYGVIGAFDGVLGRYREYGVLSLVLAGIAPVPFMLFTIAAGFHQTLSLPTLAIGLLIGRTGRSFLLGALLYRYGGRFKDFLDRHLGWFTLVFAAAVVLAILAMAFLA